MLRSEYRNQPRQGDMMSSSFSPSRSQPESSRIREEIRPVHYFKQDPRESEGYSRSGEAQPSSFFKQDYHEPEDPRIREEIRPAPYFKQDPRESEGYSRPGEVKPSSYFRPEQRELEDSVHNDLAKFDNLLKMRPNDPEAHMGKGLALFELGQREAAMRHIDRAIELDSRNAEYRNIEGEKLLELGRIKDAVMSYDDVIKINPKHMRAYGNKGFALYKLGEIDEAIKYYDKQLEINPNEWTTFAQKGHALRAQNKVLSAMQYFEKAEKIIDLGKLNGKEFTPLYGRTTVLNALEVKLVAGLKELLSIPTLEPSQTESQNLKQTIIKLNEQRETLKLQLIDIISDTDHSSAKQVKVEALNHEVETLKGTVYQLVTEMHQMRADTRDSCVRDLVEIKRGFSELEARDPELLAYCKTFYWTTINLLAAYRSLSTGIIHANVSEEETMKDLAVKNEVQKLTDLAANISHGVPIAGGALSLLSSVIDKIFSTGIENRLSNKVNAINKIIQAKLGTDDEISLNVAKVALKMTLIKEQAILYPDIPVQTSSKVKAGLIWLKERVDRVKEHVIPSVELHEKESHGVSLALQDVTLVIAFLCKSHEVIIKRKEPLDKQLEAIVKYGGLDQLLEDLKDITVGNNRQRVEEVQKYPPTNSRNQCCAMF